MAGVDPNNPHTYDQAPCPGALERREVNFAELCEKLGATATLGTEDFPLLVCETDNNNMMNGEDTSNRP